jgi:hypothetical protein
MKKYIGGSKRSQGGSDNSLLKGQLIHELHNIYYGSEGYVSVDTHYRYAIDEELMKTWRKILEKNVYNL